MVGMRERLAHVVVDVVMSGGRRSGHVTGPGCVRMVARGARFVACVEQAK